MRKLLCVSLLLLAGCETHEKPKASMDQQNNRVADQNNLPNGQRPLDPMDQSENKDDRILTQQIRKALMQDDRLSTNAKNIKVITINGVVTLRGQTDDMNEKISILEKIKKIPGIRTVDDQLETKNVNVPN